eukprot:863352-Amphidinium_carterae.1
MIVVRGENEVQASRTCLACNSRFAGRVAPPFVLRYWRDAHSVRSSLVTMCLWSQRRCKNHTWWHAVWTC